MRYVAAVAAWLQITMLEATAEVADGTVYRVVSVVAAGADCPSVLYAVGTAAPSKRDGTRLVNTG